jgi:hypothetical protein
MDDPYVIKRINVITGYVVSLAFLGIVYKFTFPLLFTIPAIFRLFGKNQSFQLEQFTFYGTSEIISLLYLILYIYFGLSLQKMIFKFYKILNYFAFSAIFVHFLTFFATFTSGVGFFMVFMSALTLFCSWTFYRIVHEFHDEIDPILKE